MAGHTIVIGQLLRANADPDRQASDGRTAMHRAAFHGWIPILRLLLEYGADPELKDADGRTAAELAKKESVTDVIATGMEEHRDIIEKRRSERPPEPVKEVPVPNLPKRTGPVTRRLVPEKNASEPDDKTNKENKAKQPNEEAKDEKKFLELHSSLDIVTKPDDFAGRSAGGYQGSEVRVQQGSLIVETSDGLFASDEVNRESLVYLVWPAGFVFKTILDCHDVMRKVSNAVHSYFSTCGSSKHRFIDLMIEFFLEQNKQ